MLTGWCMLDSATAHDEIGDVLDAIGRLGWSVGVAVLVAGLVGTPVERWSVSPDNWVVVAPMIALTGSVLLLAAVAVIVLLDPGEMLRLPDGDEPSARLGARALLWVSTGVAGHVAEPVLRREPIAIVPLLALIAGLLLGSTWSLAALDRAALLWSTRDYAADETDGVEP